MANNIELSIKVNADTGQLEILGSKFDALASKTKKADESFSGLTGSALDLGKSMLPFASAAGIVAFFTSAVKGAEEQNEAFRRLKFTLDSTGQSWDSHRAGVEAWTRAIAESTRFSDTDAITTLDKLARSTKDVSQAQSASQLAMGISVGTGRSLADSTQLVNDLINKQARAVLMAHKEFGTFVEKAGTAQEVLDVLGKTYGQAAINEDNLTSAGAKLHNAFSQLSDQVGNMLAPALSGLLNFGTALLKMFDNLGTLIAAAMLAAAKTVTGLLEVMDRLAHLDLSGAKEAYRSMNADFHSLNVATAQEIDETWQKGTDTIKRHSNERIQVSKRETDQEAQARKELAQKVAGFEAEMASKIAAIGKDTLQKKQVMLNQEIAATRKKIQLEITDEVAKQKLLDKLDFEKYQRSAALAKEDQAMKFSQSLETVDLAVQTLSILNSLGEQHSEAEVNRAKAILALEKAIAIARAIASAMAAPPGIAQAIAAAQVALVIAQFAQQFKAIDQAQAAFKSGNQQIAVSTPLDSGGTLTEVSGGGGGGGAFVDVGAGAQISSVGGGSGGGGGGGGQTIINVGGIQVNFDMDKLSVDNVDAVMSKMYEKLRQATIEGVQLAVQMKLVADKNSNLAV